MTTAPGDGRFVTAGAGAARRVAPASGARQDLLDRYAGLVMRVGVNLEPGREVAVRALLEHAPLVRALVRAGYEAGARRVEVEYDVDCITVTGDPVPLLRGGAWQLA